MLLSGLGAPSNRFGGATRIVDPNANVLEPLRAATLRDGNLSAFPDTLAVKSS